MALSAVPFGVRDVDYGNGGAAMAHPQPHLLGRMVPWPAAAAAWPSSNVQVQGASGGIGPKNRTPTR